MKNKKKWIKEQEEVTEAMLVARELAKQKGGDIWDYVPDHIKKRIK